MEDFGKSHACKDTACVSIGAPTRACKCLCTMQVHAKVGQAELRTITLARNTACIRAHSCVSVFLYDGAWCQS